MAAIVESIEIARTPDDVFTYATDFSHFPDWQTRVLSARPEGNTPAVVGSKATVTRQAGPRTLTRSEEIIALNPPSSWTVRGTGGPITAIFGTTSFASAMPRATLFARTRTGMIRPVLTSIALYISTLATSRRALRQLNCRSYHGTPNTSTHRRCASRLSIPETTLFTRTTSGAT
jgi:hypothetical protein